MGCIDSIKAGASYSTGRTTKINDWRLASVWYCCAVLVLIYGVLDIGAQHAYVRFEPVTGTQVMLGQSEDFTGPFPAACTDSTFLAKLRWPTFQYADSTKPKCYQPVVATDVTVGQATAFFSFNTLEGNRTCASGMHDCTPIKITSQIMTPGILAANTSTSHSYATSFTSGTNPATTVVNAEGAVLASFPAGSPVDATVGDWLTWAGVDLSLTELAGTLPGQIPLMSAGLQLVVTFAYSNFPSGRMSVADEVTCIVTVRHLKGMYGIGPRQNVLIPSGVAVVFTSGADMRFEAGGNVGKADLGTMITALTSLSVLFGYSYTVVDLVGGYLLPARLRRQFGVVRKFEVPSLGELADEADKMTTKEAAEIGQLVRDTSTGRLRMPKVQQRERLNPMHRLEVESGSRSTA